MDFATNLRRICFERETTPTKVLKELNLSSSKVTAWNNGSLPKQDVLVAIAQKLNCSVMDFFADDDQITDRMCPADDDEADILNVYRSLDRRAKHEFMTIVYQFEQQIGLQ